MVYVREPSNRKAVFCFYLFFLVVLVGWYPQTTLACKKADGVIIAYVTSWTAVMPDPAYVTHINYAFGHVNDNFDGVRVDKPERWLVESTARYTAGESLG